MDRRNAWTKKERVWETRYIEEGKDRKKKEGHETSGRDRAKRREDRTEVEGRKGRILGRKKVENFRKKKEVERGGKWRGGEGE